jgi:uncharacterized protein YrrD
VTGPPGAAGFSEKSKKNASTQSLFHFCFFTEGECTLWLDRKAQGTHNTHPQASSLTISSLTQEEVVISSSNQTLLIHKEENRSLMDLRCAY